MNKEEQSVLNELRANGRESAAGIAEKTGTPCQKILKTIHRLSRSGGARFTTILCFEKAGFPARAFVAASSSEEAEELLGASQNTNTLSRAQGSLLTADIIFRSMNEKHEFMQRLRTKAEKVAEFEIIECLKSEGTCMSKS